MRLQHHLRRSTLFSYYADVHHMFALLEVLKQLGFDSLEASGSDARAIYVDFKGRYCGLCMPGSKRVKVSTEISNSYMEYRILRLREVEILKMKNKI